MPWRKSLDRLSVRGKLLSKNEVLANPSAYQGAHLMIFELADDHHYEAAKTFYKEWKSKKDRLLLNFGFSNPSWMERGKNLFWSMRDRLAEIHGDTTRANKDAVYHGLLEQAGFRTMDGRPIQSIKELDQRQLWELIQLTNRLINEEEYSYEYFPHINDLRRDYAQG